MTPTAESGDNTMTTTTTPTTPRDEVYGLAVTIYNFNCRADAGVGFEWEAPLIEARYQRLTDAQKDQVQRCVVRWEIEAARSTT